MSKLTIIVSGRTSKGLDKGRAMRNIPMDENINAHIEELKKPMRVGGRGVFDIEVKDVRGNTLVRTDYRGAGFAPAEIGELTPA